MIRAAMVDPTSYAATRNPNLPWGYWCRAEPGRAGVFDENGVTWGSLRDYLWTDRLGMGGTSRFEFENQCELLLAVLAAVSRRVVPIEEQVRDLFSGAWEATRHYGLWLDGHGLTVSGFSGDITVEGHAILVMLAATRMAGAAPIPIGLPTLAPVRGLDWGETRAERERVITANEAFAKGLPERFEREELAGRSLVKLIGLPEGDNVPLTRVLWTMQFADAHARDRFYLWLIHRIDRWEAWADVARRRGAQALSEHFLHLAHADRPALETG